MNANVHAKYATHLGFTTNIFEIHTYYMFSLWTFCFAKMNVLGEVYAH